MHALFVCILTEHPNPARAGMFGPKLLRALLPDVPRNAYAVVPAHEAKPVAIGLVELTDAQVAAVADMPGVWLLDAKGWRERPIADIDEGMRAQLRDLLNDRAIQSGVYLSDTVGQAFAKMCAAIGDDADALLARYVALTGAAL
jgi:hypothetical protein